MWGGGVSSKNQNSSERIAQERPQLKFERNTCVRFRDNCDTGGRTIFDFRRSADIVRAKDESTISKSILISQVLKSVPKINHNYKICFEKVMIYICMFDQDSILFLSGCVVCYAVSTSLSTLFAKIIFEPKYPLYDLTVIPVSQTVRALA